MTTNYADVGRFHQKFGLDNVQQGGFGPREVDDDLLYFRINCLKEELEEFKIAVETGDVVEQADALVDFVYFALGTAHLLGLPWQAIWDEVHKSNMNKVRSNAKTSRERGGGWDVVKPEGWKPPRVDRVLARYGWDE